MRKLKVMTIAGTRPELIRLSEIIKKADIYFDHIFVHTGQNYDARLNDIFYDDLGIRKPDYYLGVVGDNLGETMGNIIAKSYSLMQKVKPDALLILGDTNSALSAIAAKRLKVPIFHMEAGNRCFDENLPEETNRRIVDHISDVNLPYTEHARRYLIAEGVRKEHIYVTGSPMKEVILAHQKEIDDSKVLEELGLESGKFIVLSAHREENIDQEEHFESLMNAVNGMAVTFAMNLAYMSIDVPKGYEKEEAEALLSGYESSGTAGNSAANERPNIIVIMDEAFSDMASVGEFQASEDYMPFVHKLQNGEENTITGNLQVSVCGGNTANSEFEFLTGNTMAFLPQGSIPYQQYITKELPAIPAYLKSLGYQTIATHPYYASGWERDEIYPLL